MNIQNKRGSGGVALCVRSTTGYWAGKPPACFCADEPVVEILMRGYNLIKTF